MAREVLDSMADGTQNFSVVLAHLASGQAEFSFALRSLAAQNRKNVLTVSCLPSELNTPFGTVGALIDETPNQADLLSVMRQLESKILESKSSLSSRTLLVVDNAQDMDQESAYILTQLVQARNLDLVLITTEPVKKRANLEPFESLGAELSTVLGPLSDLQMADVLRRITGAPPTSGSLAMIRSLTGGIYEVFGILCEVIRGEQVWQLVAGYSVIPAEHLLEHPRISDVLRLLLEQIEHDVLEVLSAVSLARTSSLEAVRNALHGDISSIIDSGLLILRGEQEVLVGAALLSALIIRTISPAESGRLLKSWTAFAPAQEQLDWRRTLWTLAAGEAVSEEELANSAQQANASGHYREAYELATAPTGRNASVLRRIQELGAIASSGQSLEAMEEFAQLAEEPLSLVEIESLTSSWTTMLPLVVGHETEFEKAKTVWTELVRQYRLEDNEQLNTRIHAVRLITDNDGATGAAMRLKEIIAQRPTVDVQFLMLTFGLENMLLEVDDPEVLAAISILKDDTSFGIRVGTYGTTLLAQEVSGKKVSLLSDLWRTLAGSQRLIRHLSALDSMRRGWESERDGQCEQCTAELTQATADFAASGMARHAQYAAINVMARNPLLKDSAVTALIEDAREGLVVGSPLFIEFTSLSGLIAHHDDVSALTKSLDELVSCASPAMALQGLWHVYRFQSREARQAISGMKERVHNLSQRTSSPRYRLIGEVLTKVNDHPEALVVPPHIERLQLHPEIAAVGWAAALASDSVNEELAAKARRYLYRGAKNYSNIPVVLEALEAHGLSSRELDIAKRAARGMSNKQVAAQMNLSVRTVEGHLYRAFAKLGLKDRRGLAPLGLEKQ
ncbi:helix-turn-helix transcriptional regulator [Glutamicibacter sp. AOP12-B1-11]|uniref:helix-turn-helix transcriptional regulator n=1 Tax=Glutamicibacter sp. AOP12-B1-11 TaxID=3457725 RepID=UPI0040338B9F